MLKLSNYAVAYLAEHSLEKKNPQVLKLRKVLPATTKVTLIQAWKNTFRNTGENLYQLYKSVAFPNEKAEELYSRAAKTL